MVMGNATFQRSLIHGHTSHRCSSNRIPVQLQLVARSIAGEKRVLL